MVKKKKELKNEFYLIHGEEGKKKIKSCINWLEGENYCLQFLQPFAFSAPPPTQLLLLFRAFIHVAGRPLERRSTKKKMKIKQQKTKAA